MVSHICPVSQCYILINLLYYQGEFSDLRVPCKIEGMDTPLILAIFCDVKGLSVTYGVSEDGRNPE